MRISRPSAPKCGRCRRDLLAGEKTFLYVKGEEGEPAHLCELCREPAEAEGWKPVRPATGGE